MSTPPAGPTPGGDPPLPAKAGDTTRENPWPVRALAQRMTEYVAKAPAAWVEGQLAQVTMRSGSQMSFLTLRDPSVSMSLSVVCSRDGADGVDPAAGRGLAGGRARPVRVLPGPRLADASGSTRSTPSASASCWPGWNGCGNCWPPRGSPRRNARSGCRSCRGVVGLITGRASAAESDVLANARARWPAVRFRVENPAVQGISAVPQLLEALARLDADPEVDVIVIARGGGSVEDLLPFSDETLCRAVSRCRTPVVSAIGHEPDHPIIDDVADVRCSTPTDAGKRVVPDAAAELRQVEQLARPGQAGADRLGTTEQARLRRLTSATVLADPLTPIANRAAEVHRLRERGRAQVVDDSGADRPRRRPPPRAARRPRPGGDPGPGICRRPDRRHMCVRTVADAPAGHRAADPGRRRRRARHQHRPEPVPPMTATESTTCTQELHDATDRHGSRNRCRR